MSTTDLPDDDTLETLSEEGYTSRKPTGALKYLYYAIGLGMAAFHIWFLGYSSMEPWALYYSHICFGVVLAYFLYPFSRRSNKRMPTLGDWACMLLAASACIYFILELDTIIYRVGVAPTSLDLFFSTVIVVLILEMTRRTNGWILPSIAIFFLAYALLGKYLPYSLGGHRGYSFARVFSYITGMDGMLSTPLATSASFVFLFFLFSAFLASTGAGQFFIDIAMAVAGGKRGGPAKVAVIGSALFGTISGNSAANVVASGTFTIPMMIKVGYSPRFASAVEAVASTGGQMTPPILGAAAFIIAELTGTPYLDVALATVIPAILYFVSIFYMIDLEAYKEGLHGYAKDELPDARKVLLERGHLVIPIFVLIFVLIGLNASVIKAAIWAIYSTILCTFLRKSTRLTPEQFVAGFADGAKQAVGLIAACATAGIIGVLNLTGTGLKFASGIIALSGGILPIALILTMGSSLILGWPADRRGLSHLRRGHRSRIDRARRTRPYRASVHFLFRLPVRDHAARCARGVHRSLARQDEADGRGPDRRAPRHRGLHRPVHVRVRAVAALAGQPSRNPGYACNLALRGFLPRLGASGRVPGSRAQHGAAGVVSARFAGSHPTGPCYGSHRRRPCGLRTPLAVARVPSRVTLTFLSSNWRNDNG